MPIWTLQGPVTTSDYAGSRILLGSATVPGEILEIVAGSNGGNVYRGEWGDGTIVANVGRTLYNRLRLEGNSRPLKKLWNFSVWLTKDQLLLLNGLYLGQQDRYKNPGADNTVTLSDYWFPTQERSGATGTMTFNGATQTKFGAVTGDGSYSVLLFNPAYSGEPVGYDRVLVGFQAVQY